MKWITRSNIKAGRVACSWFIKNFIDPDAEFIFVPREKVLEIAGREGAIPFDIQGAELSHRNGRCAFEEIATKYKINAPAIRLMAQIIHGADVMDDLYLRPEAPGLKAISTGFALIGLDDHDILEREFIVYDALFAYCRNVVSQD